MVICKWKKGRWILSINKKFRWLYENFPWLSLKLSTIWIFVWFTNYHPTTTPSLFLKIENQKEKEKPKELQQEKHYYFFFTFLSNHTNFTIFKKSLNFIKYKLFIIIDIVMVIVYRDYCLILSIWVQVSPLPGSEMPPHSYLIYLIYLMC